MLIGIAIALAAWAEDGTGAAGATNAWAVVVGPAVDEAAAGSLRDEYLLAGLPAHGEWPKVLAADAIGLSEPGHVLVVAAPAREDVARKLTQHLERRGVEVRSLPARVEAPEDLHLLSMDAVRVTGNGAPLYAYDICLSDGVRRDCWGHARAGDDQKLVIPFVPDEKGKPAVLWAEVGDPWVCPGTELGPAKLDVGVWLRGPADISCYEMTRPSKRRR